MKSFFILCLTLVVTISYAQDTDILYVGKTTDFEVNGKGTHSNWEKAPWVTLPPIDQAPPGYDSRFKILYSDKGIYVFYEGGDTKITSTYKKDFTEMFRADVFEVFFHTDPTQNVYFEYEINAFNKELVLMITNVDGKAATWRPWIYNERNKTIKKTFVHKENGKMTKWSAEIFFPYTLIGSLKNVPPQPGTNWKGTFTRLDYDNGNMTKWSWAPIEKSFHEYQKYKTIIFR